MTRKPNIELYESVDSLVGVRYVDGMWPLTHWSGQILTKDVEYTCSYDVAISLGFYPCNKSGENMSKRLVKMIRLRYRSPLDVTKKQCIFTKNRKRKKFSKKGLATMHGDNLLDRDVICHEWALQCVKLNKKVIQLIARTQGKGELARWCADKLNWIQTGCTSLSRIGVRMIAELVNRIRELVRGAGLKYELEGR